MQRFWKVAFFAVFAAPALAQQQPTVAPEPAWIVPAEVTLTSATPDTGAVRVILSDAQVRLGATEDEFYRHSLLKIVTSQGLAAGSLAFSWNPETEDLKIHKLNILRGEQVIDVLAKQDFLVLRRETNLEFAMLSGVLTATLQPEGLKVGDVIEVATTLTRRDPIMQGHSEEAIATIAMGPVDRMRTRVTWDSDARMTWRASTDISGIGPQSKGAFTELVLDLSDVQPTRFPEGAPARFMTGRLLEFSEFKSWANVSALFAPLYEKASTLSADSELRPEIEKIKAATKDPKARAAAALALVQEQVRYVFLGMELGALKPAEVDRTWARRFGDCKGKTAMLLAMLRELGIQAEPALVSTKWGDGLEARLPRVAVFDHIIVRATIGGKTYWLDGTRSGDGSLDLIEVPNFYWALPVRRTGGALEKLTQQPLSLPAVSMTLELDVTGGRDTKAPARAEILMRGDSASAFRFGLANLSATEIEPALRDYWSGVYPEIATTKVSHNYDASRNELRLGMEGAATMEWVSGWGREVYEIDGAQFGGRTDLTREDGPNKDAPWAVLYPYFTHNKTVIKLPDQGKGYSVRGQNADRVIGAVHYKRTTALKDGVVLMESSMRSVAPEFPNSEAEAVSNAMSALVKERVFVVSPTAAASTVPEILALLSNGREGLRDALAAVGKLIEANPDRAEHYALRAQLHQMNQGPEAARKDIDKAIELQPRNEEHYARRAAIRDVSDAAGRRADIEKALELQPNSATTLIAAAAAESEAEAYDQALIYLDKAIALRPGEPNLIIMRGTTLAQAGRTQQALEDFAAARKIIAGDALMLNQLCWAKGTMNLAIESALEDCNAALALRPNNAALLDSRGLVELRLGQFDKAIATYDAALKVAPRQSASLYCRGIAKIRKGQKKEGETDLAAAREVSIDVDKRFARFGITP